MTQEIMMDVLRSREDRGIEISELLRETREETGMSIDELYPVLDEIKDRQDVVHPCPGVLVAAEYY